MTTLPSINRNEGLQHHARLVQRRIAASLALLMTMLLLCIEHARAFAQQYHITSRDAKVLAAAASSLTRKFSSTYLSGESKNRASFHGASARRGSATKLSAWSIPSPPSMQSLSMGMTASQLLPFHKLSSGWYSKEDCTTKPPVYEDEHYDYSFGSPTDDWPSMQVERSEPSMEQSQVARGPLTAIRRVAGRVVNGLADFSDSF